MNHLRLRNDYGLLSRSEKLQARSAAWSRIPSHNRRINRGAYAWCRARVVATAVVAITGAGRGTLEAVTAGRASNGMPYFAAGLIFLAVACPFAVRLRRLRHLRDSGDLYGYAVA
jgi:hypothetical protein